MGAAYAAAGSVSNVGAAYVFKRSVGEWVQFQKWAPWNYTRGVYFGLSVALDQSAGRKAYGPSLTALIGAPGQAQVRALTVVLDCAFGVILGGT